MVNLNRPKRYVLKNSKTQTSLSLKHKQHPKVPTLMARRLFAAVLIATLLATLIPASCKVATVDIDFDRPRSGPLCVSAAVGDQLKFAWGALPQPARAPRPRGLRRMRFWRGDPAGPGRAKSGRRSGEPAGRGHALLCVLQDMQVQWPQSQGLRVQRGAAKMRLSGWHVCRAGIYTGHRADGSTARCKVADGSTARADSSTARCKIDRRCIRRVVFAVATCVGLRCCCIFVGPAALSALGCVSVHGFLP